MRFANEYGFYELNPFPGCNQIVVSNPAFIYPKYRGKGFGQKQHQERLDKAKELGYDMIMCTVNHTNCAELHILHKFGWDSGGSLFNHETGHFLVVYTKYIGVVNR